ncbi:MAG TPA: YitT family protein [Chloroflexaceae bacterium]|nr:YitT family protein [Chloroflexaceae bacterium]
MLTITRARARRALATLADYATITLGALLVALAVRVFLVPNNVVTGGLTGVAQLLSTLVGTPVGLVVLALNVPLLVVGWRRLGGFVFGARTLYAIVVMSLAIDLLAPYARPVTADPLLYSLYGGVLDGVGLGLILRARGTAGGTDIIARLVETHLGVQPGRTLLGCDVAIFGVAFFTYGPEKILYALLVAFISSRAVDSVLSAGRGSRQAMIITERPEGITGALLHDLGRGVTVLEGVGGYTGAARAVLLCIVSRSEVGALKAAVAAADPGAFVIIGEAGEVIGEGFRPMLRPRKPALAGPPEPASPPEPVA